MNPFKKQTSVATILGSFTKTIHELEAHAAASYSSREHHTARAQEHYAEAARHGEEATQAQRVAARIGALVGEVA